MQAKDIQPGVVYWHDSSNNWREYTGHDAYPVVITDTETRWHRPQYSSKWHQTPTGRHLSGAIPEDADHPRAGQPVYVRPQALRGPAEQCVAERRARRAERDADRDRWVAAHQAASTAGAALHARLGELELPGHLTRPGVTRSGLRVGIELELTAEQANALVSILGAAEERFQAGYAEGQRDAEAERRRQLGYISVEEEAKRDRQTAARRTAERCPGGPGHPAHLCEE